MTKQSLTRFLPGACQRCGGDAFLDLLDDPEWRCLQCGRVVAVLAAPDRIMRAPVARAA